LAFSLSIPESRFVLIVRSVELRVSDMRLGVVAIASACDVDGVDWVYWLVVPCIRVVCVRLSPISVVVVVVVVVVGIVVVVRSCPIVLESRVVAVSFVESFCEVWWDADSREWATGGLVFALAVLAVELREVRRAL